MLFANDPSHQEKKSDTTDFWAVLLARMIAGGLTLSDLFEQAWDSIVKIDEGMWEEIYAPLLNQTTGMGKLPFAEYASDFVPTQLAIDNVIATRPKYGDNWNYMHQSKRRGGDGLNTDENFMDFLMRNKGDHGFDVDTLAQSILEEGFQPMKGADRSGRLDPTFEFNDRDWETKNP